MRGTGTGEIWRCLSQLAGRSVQNQSLVGSLETGATGPESQDKKVS